MNKFEKKAMAKRAYRALVKMGGGYWDSDPTKRYTPDMMNQDEFVFNGSKHRYADNPELPIGVNTALWHNAARADELPKGSVEWQTARNNAKSYPKQLKRPFGPVMSPAEALYRSDNSYDKMDRNPITGLTPWETYKLTGGRRYVPDSIKLDDTPY